MDFVEEITEMQLCGEDLGFKVISTPKFHAEITGEGFEHAWGVAKSVFRAMLKNIPSFIHEVKTTCLDRAEVLSTTKVRRLSRRARCYMCAYFEYENGPDGIANSRGQEESRDLPKLDYHLIQKMQKNYRVHRGALDFDKSFIYKEAIIIITAHQSR